MEPFTTLLAVACAVVTACTCSAGPNAPPGAARYRFGETVHVATLPVGAAGARHEIAGTGTPLDGVRIHVPAGALPEGDGVLHISLNRGTLELRSGVPAGIALVVEVPGVDQFRKPVEISVPVRPRPGEPPPMMVIGYRILEDGSLEALQPASFTPFAPEAVFHTFVPLTLTWSYVSAPAPPR